MRVENADIVITDPMYVAAAGDWAGIEEDGRNMSLLGFRNYVCRPTAFPGGWDCAVRVEAADGRRFTRHFCGDSGQVGVFLLDEMLRYRPDIDIKGNPQAFALIRGFTGEVRIECGYTRTVVRGEGNVKFVTRRIDI